MSLQKKYNKFFCLQIRKIWDYKNAEDLYEILKEFLKHLYFR